ncbi:ArfGap-domain-containing protein [Durotheca rogersii]|uniref:ArfGap-domain-containing protein n=1 Tax=Durotheca rogersii TaxID=419775 RepID=UPI00222073AE|nr:ArfGap-domain-containing protein [Durotheca rogersii]KAI5866172.1 ArfGap-domain-containing protein [Durotheca rogersii]
MSRRPPNPAAERAAQNQQTIKSLLKLEANKICADCKRNKHPRWASWNLGVFICIRCSGIHRGMGTHISRVKSVDLDSWTDEQLQSILSWGNARANKYWEAKLAAAHVPSEAKIENFIRTKYELKRWVMDGPKPDPATLDVDGDDDVPLSIVKEKQSIDRKESIRKSSVGQQAAPQRAITPQADLISGADIPPRASTALPPPSQVPPKSAPAPPKAVNTTKDSLLGLDFLGEAPAAPPRPASTNPGGLGGGQSRPDLKQSILSLYASAPRPQPPPQQPSHSPSGSFGGFGGTQSASLQSPPMGHQPKKSAGGGLDDAFANLSFGSVAQPKSPQIDAFAGLTAMSGNRSTPKPTSTSSFPSLSGGSFFDSKPTPPAPQHSSKPSATGFDNFGAFNSSAATPKPAQSSSAALGDLFDWSTPAPQPAAAPAPKPAPVSSSTSNSVFNLSAKPAPAPAPVSATTTSLNTSILNTSDVWGNAWSNPDPTPTSASKTPIATKSPATSGGIDFGGWGSGTGGSFANQSLVPGTSGGFAPAPKVAADEEFGGWTSSAGGNSNANGGTKSGGFGNDDLFSNVWQ